MEKAIRFIQLAWSGLSPKERKVLIMRYGLETGTCKTLQEIGKEFRVSRERVRQVEAVAKKKIAETMKNIRGSI